MSSTNAHAVAQWFLWRAAQEERTRPISNLKLQKLVYYAQAWHLALVATPLFDDSIEAWVHGPVVRSVYFDYRNFSYGPITTKISNNPIDDDIHDHLEEVWDIYGGYDAKYLEALTHQEAPWQIAREDFELHERSEAEISHQSMIDFYQSLHARLADGEDAESI